MTWWSWPRMRPAEPGTCWSAGPLTPDLPSTPTPTWLGGPPGCWARPPSRCSRRVPESAHVTSPARRWPGGRAAWPAWNHCRHSGIRPRRIRTPLSCWRRRGRRCGPRPMRQKPFRATGSRRAACSCVSAGTCAGTRTRDRIRTGNPAARRTPIRTGPSPISDRGQGGTGSTGTLAARLRDMDTGVAIFPTHDAIAPADMARLAEEHGHESLFFPEHTRIPATRQSPWPGGSEMPRKSAHTFDLCVALTAAATATSRLRVGSGICLVIERDPIITAKEVASIDHLSGGRFEFGVGAGWNREEMENHGTDPRVRMAVMVERIEAMKAIWTQDEASYRGRHVSFERIWSWPKPAQRPHPPVLVGGNGPTVLDRVLRV